MAERGVIIDKDEYGHPVSDRYKRLGANGETEGMYVRFEPGFGLNVHIGHHRCGGTDHERMSMSIQGWDALCALVDEWRERVGDCTGARSCPADVHVHGCFADYGTCESPDEHKRTSGHPGRTEQEAG